MMHSEPDHEWPREQGTYPVNGRYYIGSMLPGARTLTARLPDGTVLRPSGPSSHAESTTIAPAPIRDWPHRLDRLHPFCEIPGGRAAGGASSEHVQVALDLRVVEEHASGFGRRR